MWRARIGIWLGLSGLCAAGACAGRAPSPADRSPSTRSVPDRIVEDEVLIADLLEVSGDQSAGCPDRCRAALAVCEAADRICAVVAELRDTTLAPRCDRARASCDEGRRAVAGCGCSRPPP